MSKLLTFLSFLFFFSSCNKKTTTDLYVIGSVHNPTANINSDTIYNYLEAIRPEIILFEADSNLFTILDTMDIKKVQENELKAVAEYLNDFPETELKAIDYQGRQAYYRKHKIFENKRALNQALDSLIINNLLDSHAQIIIDSLIYYNSMWETFYNSSLGTLNSDTSYQLIRKRQFYNYDKVLELIENTAGLKPYAPGFRRDKEFWEMRNNALAENSLQYLEGRTYNKAIIITGIFHKPYVLELIRKKINSGEAKGIEVKDL